MTVALHIKEALAGSSLIRQMFEKGAELKKIHGNDNIAVSPMLSDKQKVLGGIALSNRTLGFVNAPALMQRALPEAIEAKVNMEEYSRKRELLCDGLASAGYEFIKPPGIFSHRFLCGRQDYYQCSAWVQGSNRSV